MPIVNKGFFNVAEVVYNRQLGNDWPNVSITTTADVIEVSSNLYYTNTRVQAYLNELGIDSSANILANVVLGIDLSGNTTTDLAEGDNLYYTNARLLAHLAVSNVEIKNLTVTSNLLFFGNALTITANTLKIEDPIIHFASNNEISDSVDFGWLGHYSGDAGVTKQHAGMFRKHGTDNFYIFSQYVDENLDSGNLVTNINLEDNTFVLADVYGNVFYGKISTLSNFSTADLTEGNNLYYTNSRVQSYLDISGYQTAANILANVVLGIDLSGNTTTDLAEGDNLYYTNARVGSYVNTLGFISGVDLSGNTTTDLAEGDNLYYTNARVQSHLDAGGYQTAANILANVITSMDLSSNTTTDLSEGDNLYYTNARVGSYVNTLGFISGVDLSGNTTTDLAEGDNLYYTNSRVQSYLDVGGYQTAANILANVVLGIDLSANTTTDLAEGDNLYYTNARVQTYLDEIGYQTAANILANVTSTTDLSGNTTTDLAEGDNLYYTNDRVRSAFTAGDNISIDANGIISAGTSIFSLVSSVTTIAQSATLTYDIGVTLGNAQSIIVTVEGLIQIPGTDYSVDGANVVFTEQPPIGANIEVKLFGTNALSAGDNITIEANGRISSAASGTGLSPFLFSGL